MATPRLDARLVAAGAGSRKDMQLAIRKGRVTVNGQVVTTTGARLDGIMAIDGQVIVEPPTTIIMHKPLGHACSHNPHEFSLVYDMLPDNWPDYQTIGRLDRDTSGLLLLTTDGQLNHRLTSPKHAVEKEYHLAFTGELKKNPEQRFSKALTLDDGPCRPATLKLHGDNRATVIVTEGRYHQVRRMIAAVDGNVTELHRARIGEFTTQPTLTQATGAKDNVSRASSSE